MSKSENVVRKAYAGMEKRFRPSRTRAQFEEDTIAIMAMMFHVSRQAMKIRLSELDLMHTERK